MSSARWDALSLVVLFVYVICASLTLLAVDAPLGPHQSQQQATTTSTDQCVAKLRPFGLDVPTPSDKPENKDTGKREQADLCQQIRMADAAEEAADTAWRQYAVSVVGLFGLILTVVLTAIAADAARRAAKSANETVRAMRRTERRELRAYVGLEQIQFEIRSVEEGYVPFATAAPGAIYQDSIAATVKNYGQTPAYNVSLFCGVMVLPFLARPGPGEDFDARLLAARRGARPNILTRALVNRGQAETIKSGLFDVAVRAI